MKYKVVDETGMAIRLFHSLDEAEKFLQEGWKIVRLPKKPKVNLYELLGECLM